MKLKLVSSKIFKVIFFLSTCTYLCLISIHPQTKDNFGQTQLKIKVPSLKPGKVIFIGIISPELEELLSASKEKEISKKIEPEWLLSEEERAELEKKLEELKKQRDVLIGDFYGLNQQGYRYAFIFDRLGYIRYRIIKINEEIDQIQKKIKL
ncbi:MAG: hypothetical protein N3B16_04050 [Candidatus Aminicenantes bacterium]|nr:hypothetical protein [Candidatus Aminicenantes bacterium]